MSPQESPGKHFLKSPQQSPKRVDMTVLSPRDGNVSGPVIPGLSAKTSHETKRRYQSLPRSQYKLSVQEQVQAGSK